MNADIQSAAAAANQRHGGTRTASGTHLLGMSGTKAKISQRGKTYNDISSRPDYNDESSDKKEPPESYNDYQNTCLVDEKVQWPDEFKSEANIRKTCAANTNTRLKGEFPLSQHTGHESSRDKARHQDSFQGPPVCGSKVYDGESDELAATANISSGGVTGDSSGNAHWNFQSRSLGNRSRSHSAANANGGSYANYPGADSSGADFCGKESPRQKFERERSRELSAEAVSRENAMVGDVTPLPRSEQLLHIDAGLDAMLQTLATEHEVAYCAFMIVT